MRTGLQPSKDGTVVCPDMTGATNWFSPSYNPDTGLFYFIALRAAISIFWSRRNLRKAASITRPA